MDKAVFVSVKDGIKNNHLSLLSAAMSYYALFALVPAISSVVLIYAWISDPSEITRHMEYAKGFIPAQMQNILKDQLLNLADQANSQALGIGAIISVAISLWGASKASRAFMEALNMIADKSDQRGFFKLNFTSLSITAIAVFLAFVSLGVIILIPVLTNFIDLGPPVQIGMNVVSWVVLFSLFTFFLNFSYRFGVDRKGETEKKWFYPGSIVAALLWIIASAGFSWYAKEFGKFNKSYGSLGAMIVLMTWFYVSSFTFLIGGQVNEAMKKRKIETLNTTKKKLQSFKPIIKGFGAKT